MNENTTRRSRSVVQLAQNRLREATSCFGTSVDVTLMNSKSQKRQQPPTPFSRRPIVDEVQAQKTVEDRANAQLNLPGLQMMRRGTTRSRS